MVSLNLFNFDLVEKAAYWAVSHNHCPNLMYLYREYDSSHLVFEGLDAARPFFLELIYCSADRGIWLTRYLL